MYSKDGRRIISGFYSSETDRKHCLTPEQWEKWKELEKLISERDTGTIEIVRGRNRDQHSIIGSPGDINPWGHPEGIIGNTIDYCVQLGIFTINQIEILVSTRMSKINSHLNSMATNRKYETTVDSNGIVSISSE